MTRQTPPKRSDILHEILHACYIVQTMFDTHVKEEIDALGARAADVGDYAATTSDAIADLYQHIGRLLEEARKEEEGKS